MQAGTKMAATALGQPLLPKPGVPKNIYVGDDGDGDANKESSRNIFATAGVCLLAGIGFAASAAAMVSVPGLMVFLAGGICCLNAPTIIHRQVNLTAEPSMRSSLSTMREATEVLKEQVAIMSQTIDRLENEVDDLKVSEAQLRNIADRQTSNVMALVDLVKENEKILDGMKYNLRENFVAEMIKLTLRSDKDGDMTIDLKEARVLALRLKLQLHPYGVDLDTEMFIHVLEEDNSLSNIIKFAAEVLYPEIALKAEEKKDDEPFDEYLDEEELSPTHAPGPRKRQSEYFADFINEISMMTEEELEQECYGVGIDLEQKMNMFTVSDKYSKGSVEVAKGKRMTLLPGQARRSPRQTRVTRMVKQAHYRVHEAEKRKTRLPRGRH